MNEIKSIQYKGFWFPEGARNSDYSCSLKRIESLKLVMNNWKPNRTVVQAGGSYGVWPYLASKHFDLVYTFEPDYISFYHLVMNCPGKNIIKIQAAITESNKMVSIKRKSFTGHKINDLGTIPGIAIDSLKLVSCDAILLDTEGFEYYGIKGAKGTIEEFRPLILFEDRPELYRYHQLKPGCVSNLLENWDYVLVKDIQADKIYVPKERVDQWKK